MAVCLECFHLLGYSCPLLLVGAVVASLSGCASLGLVLACVGGAVGLGAGDEFGAPCAGTPLHHMPPWNELCPHVSLCGHNCSGSSVSRGWVRVKAQGRVLFASTALGFGFPAGGSWHLLVSVEQALSPDAMSDQPQPLSDIPHRNAQGSMSLVSRSIHYTPNISLSLRSFSASCLSMFLRATVLAGKWSSWA